MSGPRKKRRTPVKVTSAGPEPVLYAAVPGSVLQALGIARQYAGDRPGEPLVISRGDKVIHRLEPRPAQENPADSPA